MDTKLHNKVPWLIAYKARLQNRPYFGNLLQNDQIHSLKYYHVAKFTPSW